MTLTWIFFKPIVLAVLVAATQTISPVQPDERGRWGFPRTSSLEPVEHVIMGHRFRIPKAYLYLEEEWSPGVWGLKTHALMEGSLPDIAPYSRETAPLHKDYRSGTRQIVDFSLQLPGNAVLFTLVLGLALAHREHSPPQPDIVEPHATGNP